jgi:hypothetical protein
MCVAVLMLLTLIISQVRTDARIADVNERLVKLEAHLSEVHAAVMSKWALELHPVRTDRRQFATLHVGPVPFDDFDTAWCAAVSGDTWTVDIDPVTLTLAHVTHTGSGFLTLRGSSLLPRRLPPTGALSQQLPSFRVVIEAYSTPVSGDDKRRQWCNIGFVPSHTSTDGAAVTPLVGHNIHNYGGWWFQVQPTNGTGFGSGLALHGWMSLVPRDAAGAAAADTSTYATMWTVPPVPPGSAVEFAVDYAAGTCRVAFYTPEAVAGGFVDPPYAKMELRFFALAAQVLDGWGSVPARSVPTAAADSRVQLYPAVAAGWAGAIWRFV